MSAAATSKPRILCVDDEPLVLQGLQRNLRPLFDVRTAGGGHDGLTALREQGPFAVIVSDMRMPVMDGAQFLTQARALAPDTARILLTGHADLESALLAVNEGKIFRFLTKPCPPSDLIAALQEGAEHFRLIHSERELLEQTLTGAVKALSELLALSNPTAFGRAARVHRTVAALCTVLRPPDRWAIEVAAQLSQIGSIQLPADVAEKLYYGHPLSASEQALVERGPLVADQLLANIPRLEPVRAILAAQGSAAARGPVEGATGARLLRLAVDLDVLEASGLSPAEALAKLRGRNGTYDPRALEALEEEVAVRTAQLVQELSLAQVKPGMQLAEDLRGRNGVLLVARGFVVSSGLLMKLQSLENGVREPIRVLVGLARQG
jgi:response regulator RpfG family c-di-GMP phosphodiesterase